MKDGFGLAAKNSIGYAKVSPGLLALPFVFNSDQKQFQEGGTMSKKTKLTLIILMTVAVSGWAYFFSFIQEQGLPVSGVDTAVSVSVNNREYFISAAIVQVNLLAKKRSINFIDATRNFVRENSDHGDGPWFEQHASDYPYVIRMLYLTSIGDKMAERPVLQCGNHAATMATILNQKGYVYRFVRALSGKHNPLQDHVILEVFNKDTDRWELHDPNYNVKYVYAKTREVASLSEVAMADDLAQSIIPCVVGNDRDCGWETNDAGKLLTNGYYSAFEIQGRNIIFLNHNRADFSRLTRMKLEPKVEVPLREAFLRGVTGTGYPLTTIEIGKP